MVDPTKHKGHNDMANGEHHNITKGDRDPKEIRVTLSSEDEAYLQYYRAKQKYSGLRQLVEDIVSKAAQEIGREIQGG